MRSAFSLRSIVETPVLLGSFVVAVPAWFTAFVAQIILESKYSTDPRSAVGIGWFGIFVQLFLIAGVLWALATHTMAEHRLQICVFLAVAIVLAVEETDHTIYGEFPNALSASRATGAGWLLLAMVDIVWLLYFSASEDSLIYGLVGGQMSGSAGPSGNGPRRSIIGKPFSKHRSFVSDGEQLQSGGGHPYSPPMDFDKRASESFGGHSLSQSHGNGVGPMMQQNISAPVSTGVPPTSTDQPAPTSMPGDVVAQAKALYKYNRNEDDPNEVSFDKGELLQILDKSGKWFQVRRQNGETGIAPSNYLQLIEA